MVEHIGNYFSCICGGSIIPLPDGIVGEHKDSQGMV